MSEAWRKDISPTTLYVYKEEPVASYDPYIKLVGKPGCKEITEIIVEEDHPWLCSVDNCLIHKKTGKLLRGCANSKIPSIVKSIGSFAFSNCKGLKTIEIPPSVTVIGYSAFSRCESLAEIWLPDSVKQVQSWAFHDCTQINSIRFSENLKRIAESAFFGCKSLTEINLGSNLEFIGRHAFAYCDALSSVQLPDSVNKMTVNAFQGSKNVVLRASAGGYIEQLCADNDIPFKAI